MASPAARPSLEPAVAAASVVVCCGSGGVGKTTVAAAIAVEAARRGRRVVVVTIDPARRLADALGLPEAPAAGHELRRAAGEARLADELADVVRGYQAPSGTLTVLVDGDPVTLDEHALAEARETAGGTGLPHNQARALFKDLVVEWVADEVQARPCRLPHPSALIPAAHRALERLAGRRQRACGLPR